MEASSTVPLISLIIPVYNAEAFLEECFESVAKQTFQGPFEVSIYNDKSTDNSATIIEEWTKKFPELNQWIVSVVVGLNDGTEGKGCGFAKNKSIAQSHGKFLCFLDADDIMYPERLEELFHAGVDHPNDIIGSNFRRIPEDATSRYTDWCTRITTEQLFTHRFREVTIIQPTWYMARGVFDAVGYEDLLIVVKYSSGYLATTDQPEDMLFFYKHLSLGGGLYKVPKDLLVYRYHATMTSHKINRITLMGYRVRAFEDQILSKPEWSSFMIWGCGRDGKMLYKTLQVENQKKVAAFCDVNPRKVGTRMVLNHTTKHQIPILPWSEIQRPFITCVALDRFEDFETNLASLGFAEGQDFFHLV